MHRKAKVASNHACLWHVGIFFLDNLMIAPHGRRSLQILQVGRKWRRQ